jgi:hypothetical protein
MTTEQKLVTTELDELIRSHNLSIEYFSDLANSGIISMTPGVVDKLIRARILVEESQAEFLEYNLMVAGVE